MLYCDGSIDDGFGSYDLNSYLGVDPLSVGLNVAGKLVSGLLGKGPDEKKWRDRANMVNSLTASAMNGDMAAIAKLEVIAKGKGTDGTGDNWGKVYKPIVTAAKNAAAAARAKLAQVVKLPAGQNPVLIQPTAPAPVPVTPPSTGNFLQPIVDTVSQGVQTVAQSAGQAAGSGFRQSVIPSWLLPVGLVVAGGVAVMALRGSGK